MRNWNTQQVKSGPLIKHYPASTADAIKRCMFCPYVRNRGYHPVCTDVGWPITSVADEECKRLTREEN